MKLRSKATHLTLLDAMADENLFAGWFRKPWTWRTWRVVIAALFGLPMTPAQTARFTKLTGRTSPPTKQAREAWLVIGRRGGKSFIVALVAVYLACFRDYRPYLSPGERGTLMVLAADRKQARVILRYIRALLEGVPMLARLIERVGVESIDLTNSITLEIHTASFRSVRGYTVVAAICDEIAYWRSEESANPDTEILDALRPAMATVPDSLLVCLSSPYARRGALWTAYQKHYGHDGDPVLVFQSDTLTTNPTVPKAIIDDAYRDDPVAAAAEYGAEFRSDVEAFLQPEWIDNAVAEGIHEREPVPEPRFVAFTDPSGGAQDSFTLAIAHAEGRRLVLDVCRARRPPFDPARVVNEYASLLKRYGCARVVGDRYSAEWVVSAFRENGIFYEPSTRTKSDIYLEIVPQFATGAIQLLDNRQLLAELRQLVRVTGRGKDIVDHPPRGHDDQANAACGALLHAVRATPIDFRNHAYLSLAGEQRSARDDHLAALGYAGDFFEDGPFDKESFS